MTATSKRSQRRISGRRDLVRFRVAEGFYAISVTDVIAIVRPLPIVATPAANTAWPGVANHRGSIVSVVSLRALFALPPFTQRGQWIVVRANANLLALAVDRVVDVASSHEHRSVEPSLPTEVNAANQNVPIARVLLDGDQMVFVLNPQRIATEQSLPTGAVHA